MEEKRDGTYIGSIWKRENYTASDPHRRYRSGSRTGKTDEKQYSEAVSPSGGKAGHLVFAGCIFCALWACLVFAAWARACSFTAVLTARNTAVRAGIAVPITRQLPRRAVTGVWTLRTPLLWLAGCSVLVVHGPGVQLFLPGVDALQAQALAAVLMEETP